MGTFVLPKRVTVRHVRISVSRCVLTAACRPYYVESSGLNLEVRIRASQGQSRPMRPCATISHALSSLLICCWCLSLLAGPCNAFLGGEQELGNFSFVNTSQGAFPTPYDMPPARCLIRLFAVWWVLELPDSLE